MMNREEIIIMNQKELKRLYIIHKLLDKKLYQIKDFPEGMRTKQVFVEERLNGRIYINYNGFSLKYKLIDIRPAKPKEPYKPRKTYVPPQDHPWRKFRLPGSLNFEEKEEVLAGAL